MVKQYHNLKVILKSFYSKYCYISELYIYIYIILKYSILHSLVQRVHSHMCAMVYLYNFLHCASLQ